MILCVRIKSPPPPPLPAPSQFFLTDILIAYMFTPSIVVCKNTAEMDAAALQVIQDVAKSRPDKASMALSGGSSPRSLYTQFLEKHRDLATSRFVYLVGDDRLVPFESDDSNYKMAHEALLHAVPPSHVIKMDPSPAVQSAHDPVEGEKGARIVAKQFAAALEKQIGFSSVDVGGRTMQLPVLDLVLLGFGSDGHTASIFPDSIAATDDEPVTSVSFPSPTMNPKVWRVTLSRFVIQNARHVLVMAAGKPKKWVVDGVVSSSATEAPTARFLRECKGKVTFIVDEDAKPSQSHC
ncbi:6-phosphogluconolactonase [Angomonas deanei]|nr:6-phosphogluconolactonase [Angomonas deanei]|eukprot:EPY26418.1 6-phosphogluconolactonase [Angomonas deanei]